MQSKTGHCTTVGKRHQAEIVYMADRVLRVQLIMLDYYYFFFMEEKEKKLFFEICIELLTMVNDQYLDFMSQ